MTTPLATVPQVLKLAGMFTDVPRDQMNGIGYGLAAIVAEYLCQPTPKRISLKTVRQVLGLPPLADGVWITVDWQETPPKVVSGSAVMSGKATQHRTELTRLRPTDVGLSNDAHPNDVIELALTWGYQRVPRAALESLFRNPSRPSFWYPGDAMVPLSDAQYAYLWVSRDGEIREADQMYVTAPNFSTTWSVVMAY